MAKKLTIIVSFVLACLLLFTACGEKKPAETTPKATEKQETKAEENKGGESAELEDHKIVYARLGDDWMINYYVDMSKFGVVNAAEGNVFDTVSAEFTSETMLANIRSLCAAGDVDGIIYYGAFPTLHYTVSEICEQAKMPFGIPDQTPLEEQYETLRANPYFVGSFGANAWDVGYQMGEYVASLGYKKALTLGASVGEPAHDGRLGGFKEAFEKAGGVVLACARCSGPPEATTKASDILAANPDADCFYCSTSVFAGGAIAAQQNMGIDIPNFTTDLDKDLLTMVRDGSLEGDGGAGIVCTLTSALIQNYLDGHPILDENGQAPINTDLVNFLITKDNVDDYEKNFIDENPFSVEGYRKLLWRYNPDVTYKDYQDLINNWSLQSSMDMKK